MADIVLAEVDGRGWLVSGEEYIDDLLANMLDPHVSIEIVACESQSDMYALYERLSGPDADGQPWMIHPGVMNRVRSGKGEHAVIFPAWSAAFDPMARSVIESAASLAVAFPDRRISLVRYAGAEGAGPIGDLQNLRAGLIEAELVKLGVDAARIGRETRDTATVPNMSEESQRVDILMT